MTALAAQLLAALDRAEETAREALYDEDAYGADPARTDDGVWSVADGCRVEGIGILIYDEGGHNSDQAAHIAANDPAHVLRLCAALREVVKLHYGVDFGTIEGIGHVDLCHECRDERWPCPTLLALASVWDVPGVAE